MVTVLGALALDLALGFEAYIAQAAGFVYELVPPRIRDTAVCAAQQHAVPAAHNMQDAACGMQVVYGPCHDSAWRREPIGMTAETQEKENSASERAGFLTQ